MSIAGVAEQGGAPAPAQSGHDALRAGPAAASAPGTARIIVESAARRLVLVVLAPWILAVSFAALSPDSAWPTGTVVTAAALGLLGYGVFAVADRRAPLLGLLVASCLGLGMASPLGLTLVGSSLIAGWLNLTSFTLGALAPWRIGIPLGVATVLGTLGLVAARSVTAGQPQEPGALAAIALYALNDLLVVALAATILRRTAGESDAMALARARAAALAARAEAGQAELRRVFRLIHDTVMNTLGAVARLASLDRVSVAERCAADLEVLHSVDSRPSRDPASVVRSIRERAGMLGLSLDSGPIPDGPRLAPGVGEVLEGAAWEALNNIAKHSGQHSARLDWTWDGQVGRLAITDGGRGVHAGSAEAQRLRGSIEERCATSGISPSVVSSPGSGTSVILTWEAPASTSAADGPMPVEHELAAILAESVRGICAVLAVSGVIAAIALPPGPARWGCIGALGVVLALGGVAHLRMRGRPASPPGLVYPVATMLATWAPAVTLEGCSRSGSWNWGPLAGIAVLSAAILLDRRSWVIVASVAAYVLGNLRIIAEVGSGAPACTQEAVTVLVVNLALILGVLAYRRQLTRAWGDGRRQHDAMLAELAGAARAEQVLRTRRELLGITLRVSEPVLLGLSRGEMDPGDPDVRAQAARAERILRSLAAIPVGDPEGAGRALTDLVLSANDRGIALTLSVSAGLGHRPGDVRGRASMLAGALRACPPGSAVQVTTLRIPAGSHCLVLIDPRTAGAVRAGPGGAARTSEDPGRVLSTGSDGSDQHETVALVQTLEAAGWTVTVVGDEVLAEVRWEDRA